METLRYSRSKLYLGAAGGLVAMAVLLGVFSYPALLAVGRTHIFGTPVGHYVGAPLLIAIGALFVWRVAAIASGGRLAAVECTSDAVVVTGLWQQRRIAWTDLVSVRLERRQGQSLLAFRSGSGGLIGGATVRVSLNLLDLHPARVVDFMEAVERRRAAASTAAPRAAAASVAVSQGVSEAPFDADAAIARYLARKAGEEAQPRTAAPLLSQAQAPHLPPRPSFGRKLA